MESLRDLIESALHRFEGRTALWALDGSSASYADLDRESKVFAEILAAFLKPTDRVSICLPKSFASVAAIFGTIRAGGCYLPIDHDAPAGRNAFILGDAGARALVTTPTFAEALKGLFPPHTETDLGIFGEELRLLTWEPKVEVSIPKDVAYILYTSGSTGRPKGVMISQDNALCFIEWAAEEFQIQSSDVISSIAPFHFDLSVFDLYASMLRGAGVVLIDAASSKNPMLLAEAIGRFGITVWYATPTTLKLMLRFGRLERHPADTLRVVLFAGEVFPIGPLNELRLRWPQARFANLYGPTETNVCTFHILPLEVETDRTEPYPIGIPCPFASCWIDGPQGIVPAAPGLEGELLVGGRSVMAGYLNNPERNAESLTAQGSERLYRTGDVVRADASGCLHYISRKDRMVKRNGYRIELGEIEAALHRHPDISEAGVISKGPQGEQPETRIVGYYGTRSGQSIALLELQEFLAGEVPAYMLPDRLVHLQDMPRTSTHKIDYPALTAQD